MASCRVIFATALVLVTSSVFQQIINRFDNSSRLILDVLNDTHAFGSLAFSATCDFHQGRFPIVPRVRTPRRSGSAVDDLQFMFGGDSKIRVTREPTGMVRMAETDVPTDILEVKIHHISFHATPSGSGPGGGEMRLVFPPDHLGHAMSQPTSSLLKALARGRTWREWTVAGEVSDKRAIAQRLRLNERYVSRVLECAFLAPDIVESILNGQQPSDLTFAKLTRGLPMSWAEQRKQLGFPSMRPRQ